VLIDNGLYDSYLLYDLPIPYGQKINTETQEVVKKGFDIYAPRMVDYFTFNTCVNCLLMEKNQSPDVAYIKMSYLEFLFHFSSQSEENKSAWLMLLWLLQVVLREQPFDFFVDREVNKLQFKVNDEVYTSADFDEIKEIICLQNEIDIDDTYMHPELKEALEEALRVKDKLEKNDRMGSIEDMVIAYHISTGFPYEKIWELSVRKFTKGMQKISGKLEYEILRTASMSGMVEFKEDIPHWLNAVEKRSKYADVMVEASTIFEKIGNVSAASTVEEANGL